MRDPDTIRVYDARAAECAEMTDDHNATAPKLEAFVAACSPGAGWQPVRLCLGDCTCLI